MDCPSEKEFDECLKKFEIVCSPWPMFNMLTLFFFFFFFFFSNLLVLKRNLKPTYRDANSARKDLKVELKEIITHHPN